MIRPVVTGLSVLAIALAAEAVAQERGTLNPQPLPPLADPADPNTPAKELFARKPEPVHLAARAIGNYVHGCLAGAVALPINGKTSMSRRVRRSNRLAQNRKGHSFSLPMGISPQTLFALVVHSLPPIIA